MTPAFPFLLNWFLDNSILARLAAEVNFFVHPLNGAFIDHFLTMHQKKRSPHTVSFYVE